MDGEDGNAEHLSGRSIWGRIKRRRLRLRLKYTGVREVKTSTVSDHSFKQALQQWVRIDTWTVNNTSEIKSSILMQLDQSLYTDIRTQNFYTVCILVGVHGIVITSTNVFNRNNLIVFIFFNVLLLIIELVAFLQYIHYSVQHKVPNVFIEFWKRCCEYCCFMLTYIKLFTTARLNIGCDACN